MSRDGLKEKLFTAERAAAQQLRATEMSTGLLRQKLQQCEKLLRDMATHTDEGQVDAAALRKQIVQLELSLSSERVQLDEARAGMLKRERQSAELLAQRTADAAAAKAAMVKAAAACRERDDCAKRTEQLQARLHVQECAAAAREAEGEAREAKLKKALGSARRQGAALEAQLVRAKSEAERALKEQRSTRAEAQKAATGHKREGGMLSAQLGESRKARQQLQEAAEAAATNETTALRQQREWRAMFKQASEQEEALLEELRVEKGARARLEALSSGLNERLRKQEEELEQRQQLCADLEKNLRLAPSARDEVMFGDQGLRRPPPATDADTRVDTKRRHGARG